MSSARGVCAGAAGYVLPPCRRRSATRRPYSAGVRLTASEDTPLVLGGTGGPGVGRECANRGGVTPAARVVGCGEDGCPSTGACCVLQWAVVVWLMPWMCESLGHMVARLDAEVKDWRTYNNDGLPKNMEA